MQAGGQKISDAMMVSKEIIILAKTAIFDEDIRDWRRQATDQKTWENSRSKFTELTTSKGKQ